MKSPSVIATIISAVSFLTYSAGAWYATSGESVPTVENAVTFVMTANIAVGLMLLGVLSLMLVVVITGGDEMKAKITARSKMSSWERWTRRFFAYTGLFFLAIAGHPLGAAFLVVISVFSVIIAWFWERTIDIIVEERGA